MLLQFDLQAFPSDSSLVTKVTNVKREKKWMSCSAFMPYSFVFFFCWILKPKKDRDKHITEEYRLKGHEGV